ncbi:MAG: hypothetical protein M3547_13315 [Acidobacteriota bacterium]|nr:hypothetical protein [Acidobacteriota bacterium]
MKQGAAASSTARSLGQLAISCLCLLVTSPLSGFNYKEHQDVGNEALRRAVMYFERRCGALLPKGRRDELMREILGLTAPNKKPPFTPFNITYGHLVASVDYVTEPSELAFQGGLPPSSLKQPGVFFNERLINRRSFLRLLHATHHDRNHFQGRALITYQTWHRTAVHLVRQSSNDNSGEPETADRSEFHDLSLALIYSAYADHFLQDFFAPGHIRTPRFGLHDAASMGIHDYFNRTKGEEFEITRIADLDGFFEDTDLFQRLSAQPTIRLLGDGTLSDHADQAEFMAAVQARLLADILAPRYGCSQLGASILAPIEWTPYELVLVDEKKGKTRTRTPLAVIPFGKYVRKELRNMDALGWTPIVGAHAGYQSLFSGGRSSGRGKFDFEVIPLGVVGREWRTGYKQGSRWYYPRTQLGLGVDYSYISSRDYSGHGMGLRLYRPVTQIDFQFSGGAAVRWYDAKDSPEKARKIAYDVRGEFGYGILFLGIGVGREHHLVAGKGFEPALAFSATVSVGFPPSAIPKLRKDQGVKFKSAEPPKPAADSDTE